MLVYKEETSRVTIKVPGGGGGNLLSLFIKSVVSCMYDGREIASGWRKQSTKREMFSVGAQFEDTIGLQDCQAYGFYVEDKITPSSNGQESGIF